MNYYIFDQGKQQGPFAMEHIAGLWRTEALTMNALYCPEGGQEWLPLINSVEMSNAIEVLQSAESESEELPLLGKIVIGVVIVIVAALVLSACYQIFVLIAISNQWSFAHQLPYPKFLGNVGWLVVLLPLYFLPTVIAAERVHAPLVFVLNLLFGWTFVVWVACIFIAVASPRKTTV